MFSSFAISLETNGIIIVAEFSGLSKYPLCPNFAIIVLGTITKANHIKANIQH